MQHSKIWTVLFAGVGGLVIAAWSLGGSGLGLAQAQMLNEFAVIIPIQTVERIEDGAGNNLGAGTFQARVRVSDQGTAKGSAKLQIRDSRYEFRFKEGRATFDTAGTLTEVSISGRGEVSDPAGRRTFFDFTANARPEPGSPDCVIWDIAGGDVTNAGAPFEFHLEAEGKIQVKFR